MKHFKLLLLLLSYITIFSCSKSEPDHTEPTPKPIDKLELSSGTDLNPVISTDGGNLSILFTASTPWSAEAVNDRADAWCSVSPTSGNAGAASIVITTKPNTEPDERSASIIIKAGAATQTIKVTQKQKDALTVTASSFEISAEEQAINIEVKANVNVTYKIAEDTKDWIKYIETKALKTSTLTFNISQNNNIQKREGKIIIGEGAMADTIKVYQAGEKPSIVLTNNEYTAKAEGESFAIDVASNIDVNISIVHPTGAKTWLKEDKTKTMSTNTYYFTADANEEYNAREAKIIFSNKENNLSDTVKVIQTQKDAIVLAKSVYEIDNKGGNISVEVAHNIDYKVSIGANWITKVETKGLDTDYLTFNIAENKDYDNREAFITFSSPDGSISQKLKVCQSQTNAIIISKKEHILGSDGGDVTVEIRSNVEFTVQNPECNWIHEVKTKGLTTHTLYYKVDKNSEYDSRSASIVITNTKNGEKETVLISQMQKDAIVLAKSVYEIDNKGGNISVEVAHNIDYKVSIGANWITKVETKGLDTDYLTFNIAKNKDYDNREAFITFSSPDGSISQKLKVCQSQTNAIIISKKEHILGSKGGDITVEIRSNVEFTVQNPECNWIHEVKTKGLTTHTLYYNVDKNSEYDSRSASIVITNTKTGEKDAVVISQMQKDALVLAKNEYEFGVEGGSLNLKLLTNLTINDIEIEISEDAKDWLSQTNTKGLDTLSLSFNIAPCEPGNDRIGIIKLKGKSFIGHPFLVQTIKIRQGWRKEVMELQRKVLIELYNATNGKNWKNAANWCTDKPIKEWKGVWLDRDGIIERLYLTSMNIQGQIPECIGKLTTLKYLDLYDNNITGSLPDSLSNCKELTNLVLANNPLTGAVLPESWGQLEKLEELHIYNTQLAGNIPQSIGKLKNLKYLYLGGNNLNGSLPESIGNLENLIHMELQNNNLTGSIPESFKNLKNLEFISLTYNKFNGIIPKSFQETEIWKNYWPNILDGNSFDVSNVRLYGPTFKNIRTVDGKVISDDIYKKNKITVLCGFMEFPYDELLKSLKKTYEEYKDKGLGIICYTRESDEKKVRDYMRQNGIDWDVFSLPNNSDKFLLRCSIFPLTNIIDETGEIVHTSRIDMPDTRIHKFVYMYFYDGYESTDFSKDGEVHTLQKATKGKGIDIIFMGDAFTDRDVDNGTYHKVMETAMEKFFKVEPYKSFRDHFNVHYVTVISKHGVYGETYAPKFEMYSDTALECIMEAHTTRCGGNDNTVLDYAMKTGIDQFFIDGTIIVMMNSPEYKGTCYMYFPFDTAGDWGEGLTISYFPIGEDDTALEQVLNHEANGHGFGKLADEYSYESYGKVPQQKIEELNMSFLPYGWYKNIDFTDNKALVKWAKFLSDSRYKYDGLGVYEGGMTYWTGVWRPTENSIMRHNTGGFNAPSREAIYYRIHKLAYGTDWQYDYEKFVEYDAINRKNAGNVFVKSSQVLPLQPLEPLHPPVIIKRNLKH